MVIYHDWKSATAPLHDNGNIEELAKLEAGLGQLDMSDLGHTIKKLEDGQDYYRLDGAVEATYYSASTKYTLIVGGMYMIIIGLLYANERYSGKRYDTVTAEYV